MSTAHSLPRLLFLLLWICALLPFGSGCDLHRAAAPGDASLPHSVKSIAVVGFLPAVRPDGESGLIRNPLVGAVRDAAPVPVEVVERLTENLFSKMAAGKKYEFLSPGQAQGTLAGLLSSNPAMEERELFMRLGKGMEADGVLAGYLYRWVEREGAEYGVNRPASVAFDLYLIQSSNGAILWKGGFDKAQQSLSENILDIDTFLKAKGKWMSVEELAEMGLSALVERFPAGTVEGESRKGE